MCVRRLSYIALIGGLAVICTAARSIAQPQSDAPLMRAEELQLEWGQPRLTRAELDTLVGRWIAQLDVDKPDRVIGSVELLVDAPRLFVDALVERLGDTQLFEEVYKNANQESRDRLWNSRAVGLHNLRGWLGATYRRQIARLSAGQAGWDRASSIALATAGGDLRSIDAELAGSLLDLVASPGLDGQLRGEFLALLKRRTTNLAAHAERLRRWAAGEGTVLASREELRTFASLALFRMEAAVDPRILDLALDQGEPAEQAAALSVLAADPASVQAHMARIIDVLRSTRNLDVWSRIFRLLTAHAPSQIEQLYSDVGQAEALKLWPDEIVASFVRGGDPARHLALRGWRADTAAPSGGPVQCADLRWRLAVLETIPGEPSERASTLWRLLTRQTSCREDISAEIERALLSIGRGRVRALFLPLIDRDGPRQFARMGGRLKALSDALADDLHDRLARDDEEGARKLLEAGVFPSAQELARRATWKAAFGPQPTRAIRETDLLAVQAVRQPPDDVRTAVARLVRDPGSPVALRAAGLVALAADGVERNVDVFLGALNDASAAVSRPALVLLAHAYDAGRPPDRPRPPDPQILPDLITRAGLEQDAAMLLGRLARYGEDYADLYVEQDLAKRGIGPVCFRLAQVPRLRTTTVARLLNTAALRSQSDAARALSCLTLLLPTGSPAHQVAEHWGSVHATELPALYQAIRDLWVDDNFMAVVSPELEGRLRTMVLAHQRQLPYTVASLQTLRFWRTALAARHARDADSVGEEITRRIVLAGVVGLPSTLFVHLGLWIVLLVAYPRLRWVQAAVFWNPNVRKLAGLGYIDVMLVQSRWARRRLFSPFAEELLGDVRRWSDSQLDRKAYFPNSRVWHRLEGAGYRGQAARADEPIMEALTAHRGRVLLLGKSGLGKSSFLRHSIAKRATEDRDVLVYLRADECRGGVEVCIESRMQEFGRDARLLQTMIYTGKVWIYIDGYNEVDVATQDVITGFLGRYPLQANILVASQIPLRGFSSIETFEIVPLSREQMREFLLSRDSVLSAEAPVQGEAFALAANSFLDDILERKGSDPDNRVYEEIISNPMDLTSVAILLGDGRVPDLFALEAQQFDAVRRHLGRSGAEFRTVAFSRALLEQRLADQENLEVLPFKPEVTALVDGKLAIVRTDADAGGRIAAQEVRFRHDRIRDYFTHFAFLAMSTEERAQRAEDARFAGVFPYLARALAADEAEDLRERLIRRAAEIEDHRVSDSFLREYTWRQRFAATDPEWMLAYDLPQARQAEERLAGLDMLRRQLDENLGAIRAELANVRTHTRILSTADSAVLRDRAAEILIEMGAVPREGVALFGRALWTPDGEPLSITGLAQPETIRDYHVTLLAARARGTAERLLVVTNTWGATDPTERLPDLSPEQAEVLASIGAVTVPAVALYEAFKSRGNAAQLEEFWLSVSTGPARPNGMISGE